MMPLHVTWQEIGLRLLLTVVAGGAIGLNRGVRGHAAGLKTTILVCLAASVAMIQANILLPLVGKTPDSFAVMDLMRLPLGILTGVGFIGGGAILKRGDLVTGVTTAATLWVITVIGLCLGGGQIALGVVATVLAVFTLVVLKFFDDRIPRQHRATVKIRTARDDPPARVVAILKPIGYRASFLSQHDEDGRAVRSFEIRWKQPEATADPSRALAAVTENFELVSFEMTSEFSD